ncbi:hypothetical protein PGQ11_006354 [Apiospora arundinis]|uniref:Uncharacterized protein n=1 Tax=Apiospora arundinis TaxID=335852 RepID=A0ABR2ITS5_9PEZI
MQKPRSSRGHPQSAMALFNPLQFFVFPFMIFVALPLAICAGITTVFAFAILFLRLFWVYFDVGMETIRYVILGHTQPPPYSLQSPTTSRLASATTSPQITRPPSPENTSPIRTAQRRRRRSSRAGSIAGITPLIGGLDGGSGTSLGPTAGLGRDFEGVGGWRSDQNTEDERVWESLNSRLEMPDPLRYHFRSHSGSAVIIPGLPGAGTLSRVSPRTGSTSPPDLMRKSMSTSSPNSSRSRTPTRKMEGFTSLDRDGYFPPYTASAAKKISV